MTEQVVINETPEMPTLEESAAEMGLLDEQAPETGEERPGWLPEKFESPEAMAKAYGELEARMSRQEAPAEEAEADAEEISEDDAREATEQAGVDFDALTEEYYNNEGLTEDSYEKLNQAGIPRHIVDQFIAGQEASAEMQRNAIVNEAGGDTKYTEMREWAADNFSQDEIAAFDETVTGGNPAAVRMAVAGLKARFEASQSTEPQRMVSGQAASANVYRSTAELLNDMSDPRYSSDPAYRRDVEAKLGRSDIM